MKLNRIVSAVVLVLLLLVTVAAVSAAGPRRFPTRLLSQQTAPVKIGQSIGQTTYRTNVAFDVSKPLRDLPKGQVYGKFRGLRPELGPRIRDRGYSGDGALQQSRGWAVPENTIAIAAPILTFEGIGNQDNFNIFGFRVNPPDPVGDVGPNHYVEMVNLAYAVYDKQGNLLLGPLDTGSLWADFPIEDCTDPSGDPIVVYDQWADRWLLSQFTTRGAPYYYDCVAISQTGDPTGAYYRYAFPTQEDLTLGPSGLYYFPDYPKYSVWTNSYLLTTRDFGDAGGYGISVYGLERNKMVNGESKVGVFQVFLDSAVVPLNLLGDGLLPADVDGVRRPRDGAPAPIVGTQDDDYVYGATFDALNIYDFAVKWKGPQTTGSLTLVSQLPVAEFDSSFPCGPSRGCIPQPGITNPDQYLDILSYRQRPTYRLAYRNFGNYEAMVTAQSVEALPGIAGMRWYEIRRQNGQYSVYQQGTYAPADGVHRWMGSVAMDKQGNIALGYSVSDATTVYPGIRFTGRQAGDPLGQMTLGEGVIMNGSGVQTTTNSRWGDYTSMNVDPTDDCTFWYVNEYYAISGLPLPLPPPPLPPPGTTAPWQTRIGSFRLPGCN
jgi:hypothetical protein